MNWITLFVVGLLTMLSSCNGQTEQNQTQSHQWKEHLVKGDTVHQMDDELWYVFQDTRGHYWFASNGQGVYRYDGKTILNFTTKDGLANDTVRQIQEDKYGNIYFSTFGGITQYDGQRMTTLQAIESHEWILRDDDLWFSVLGKRDDYGPYRYDGTHLYHLEFPKHYLHDEMTERGINPFFGPYDIYTIYKDRKGAMWFGTSVFGACRFDGTSVKWMYEYDLTIALNGGTFGIRSIFEDREGSFWICNTLHRYVFDWEKTKQSDRLQYQKKDGMGKADLFGGDPYVYYSCVVEDQNGHIWLTTWDQGVYKYDGKNITNYAIKDGDAHVQVISMHKDIQGNLWLGTANHGAFKFNGTAFERFEPK